MSLLLVPVGLCHDHSCIKTVEGLGDPRLLLVCGVAAVLLGTLGVALASPGASGRAANTGSCHDSQSASPRSTRQLRLLMALVLIVLPYIPYSHVRVMHRDPGSRAPVLSLPCH